MTSPSRSQSPPPARSDTWADVDAHRLHARVMGRLFGEPAAPTAIGRFRVERRLGSGAMGIVYAAVDDQLGRRVAIKLLHPHLQGEGQGRARLLREARAMARLEHEHVARIYEVGAWGDQVYIAMELIDGVTLDAWLRERPRPWQAVLAVYVQAGLALAAAHHAGLLHRDFKPENVIVDAHGRARVLDFGLTCALDDDESLDDELAPLTRTGSILGTPAYMAPEQQRLGAAEARSDQFSFCVALFEGVFGLRPFAAIPRFGPVEIAPIPRDSRVPARLRRAIMRGLAEAPEARWPTMEALLAALQAPRRFGLGALSRTTTIVGAAVGGAMVAGLFVLAVVLAGRGAPDPEADPAHDHGLAERTAIFDPDAELRAQRAAGARQAQALRVRDAATALLPRDPTTAVLLLRELDDPGALAHRALAEPISAAIFTGHDGPVRKVTWSVDSEPAVDTVDAAGQVRRFALAGGPPRLRERLDIDPMRGPGGVELLVDPRGHMSLQTGVVTTRLPGVAGPPVAVAWSRDGARVAGAGPRGDVWLVTAATRRAVSLGRRGAPVGALAWDEVARHLAVGRDDGTIEVWRVDGRPRRIAARVGEGGIAGLALGSGWVASGGDDGSARVWRLGAAVRPYVLRGHLGPVRVLAFDPRGATLVTGSDDGSARVWALSPAALAVHDLGGPVNAVAWSPDGALLAAAGDRGVDVWLLPAAGGAGERRAHEGSVFALAWSPDGQHLAVADDSGAVTWLARGDGVMRREQVDRRGALLALAWDPRGAVLAAGGLDESITTWSPEHVVSDMPERTRTGLRHGTIEALAWSPIDDRLAVVTADGRVVLVHAGATSSRDLGHALSDLAWSPRGDLLAVVGEGRALVRVTVESGALGEFGRAAASLWSVAWDPRDRHVVAGGADGALYFWPLHTDGRPEVFAAHGDIVHALAFDPHGQRLASASADGRVVIWPRIDGDLRDRLAAATTACLGLAERQRYLGEPADVAATRVAACERPDPAGP